MVWCGAVLDCKRDRASGGAAPPLQPMLHASTPSTLPCNAGTRVYVYLYVLVGTRYISTFHTSTCLVSSTSVNDV